jgi:hypothetical protein
VTTHVAPTPLLTWIAWARLADLGLTTSSASARPLRRRAVQVVQETQKIDRELAQAEREQGQKADVQKHEADFDGYRQRREQEQGLRR